jgi:hypothetical protein
MWQLGSFEELEITTWREAETERQNSEGSKEKANFFKK